MPQQDDILARLMARNGAGEDPWSGLAATQPEHEREEEQRQQEDAKLDELLGRISQLAGAPVSKTAGAAAPDATAVAPTPQGEGPFLPVGADAFRAAGLTDTEVESLALKYLLARGDASGRDIAEQVRLPFVLLDDLLRQLKNEQLVVHRCAAAMNDFQYQLTELGRERARRYSQHCSYFGAAPVPLIDYVRAVRQQSLTRQNPTVADLHRAFEDILLNKRMLDRLGPAINSGRGLFLFGAPGNGKTSIAERVTSAFGQSIWIPRAIGIDGEIIRLFDPVNHVEVPLEANQGLIDQRKIDRRWVRIRRPTIVAAGELTMEMLEVAINPATGICEAPLQMKSNCGTLVIDDFGRQRMRVEELLNRWIVPLEKHYDFLNLPNGKKIEVPFDQLLVFSTNLEPRDLVDEAFLRRIPYKIEVHDPTEQEFHDLFRVLSEKFQVECRRETIDYLVREHYRKAGRKFRFCHPRDLLMQIQSHCAYHGESMELNEEHFDLAVENYFAVMADK